MSTSVRASAMDPYSTLENWRAEGAERMNPLRFGTIHALTKRMDQHQGQARQLLQARLAALIEAYAADLQDWSAPAVDEPVTVIAPSPLRELLDGLAVAESRPATTTDGQTASPAMAREDLPALRQARQQWTRLRTDSQLRASLQPLPSNAGPLNSAVLVHRALSLMRDVSPAYLQHFILYADTLSSLQRLRDAHPSLASSAATSTGKAVVKPARKRSRKRTS